MLKILTTQKSSQVFKGYLSDFDKSKIPYSIHHLSHGIPEVGDGDILLVLGTKPTELFRKQGVIHKAMTLNKLRGTFTPYGDGVITISFDPGICDQDPGRAYDIIWDFRLIHRLITTGTTAPTLGKYTWGTGYTRIRNKIDNATELVTLSLDLETIGLDPYRLPDDDHPGAKIVSVSVTDSEGMAELVYLADLTSEQLAVLKDDLRVICTSPKVKMVGANLKYDSVWMKKHFGFFIENMTLDTVLVGSLLDENRGNSLELHAKIYTSMGGYDSEMNTKYDKGRMDLIPKDDLKDYAGGDTDACFRTAAVMKPRLLSDGPSANLYTRLLKKSSRVFAKLEHRGVVVDRDRYDELKIEVTEAKKQYQAEALGMMSQKIRHKYRDNLALTRSVIIKDFMFSPLGLNLTPTLFTAKSGEPSTAFNHLKTFQDVPEAKAFIDTLKKYNSASKTLSTYITGFMKHLRSDGKFHPSYMLHRGAAEGSTDEAGTVTGRLSAKDPAYQCQKLDANILTERGYLTLGAVIRTIRGGGTVKVLTHTGKWHQVTDTYDNGVQPIYRVTTNSGRVVECTGNHPILTPTGFTEVQYLSIHDEIISHAAIPRFDRRDFWEAHCSGEGGGHKPCYLGVLVYLWKNRICTRWKPKIGQYNNVRVCLGGEKTEAWPQVRQKEREAHNDENVQVLGEYEGSMQHPYPNFVPVLRRSWHYCLSSVGLIREFFRGHGRNARGVLHRTNRCGRGLHPRELLLDSKEPTEFEQAQFKEEIINIEILPPEPTFGITVKGAHSYISDGVVVHNTIPKHTIWADPLRSVYVPPPGMAILKLDYSQGELRVTACVANETNMIQTYLDGVDLHMKTGATVYGLTLEQALSMKEAGNPKIKGIRQGGKAGNFGLIYGMQAEGFVSYARDTYGVELSLAESTTFRGEFFDLYPGLVTWHERYIEHARMHGFVRSPFGRVRHLPLIHSQHWGTKSGQERMAINSPIQSTLSDMMQLAMVLIDEQYPDLWMFGTTHDEVQCYVPEDQVMEWAKRLKDIMENLPFHLFGWKPQLPFYADAEASNVNLAVCEELEVA